MPTIAELPSADAISAADELPISQAGTARAASVGALLASTQPAIIVGSPSLLGRTSLGSGGPEGVDVGLGISLSGGMLVADGLDHAAFNVTPTLSLGADLVISNQGSPMLMQASLLRGLFSAGQNVAIDPSGVISTSATITGTANDSSEFSISELPVVTALAAQDLVAVNKAGSNSAISYNNLLSGVTIDHAQAAGPVGSSDQVWAAQGSNVMVSQTFSAIWVWIASQFPTYKAAVVEIATNVNLDTTVHNGRILVCSEPVTLTPLINNMGSGFQCVVINASMGNLTLGTGFVSSSGSFVLTPWQSATICCATYSGGTIAFAAMPASGTVNAVPGQVTTLASSGTGSSTISLVWQAPVTGGAAASYVVQFRMTGTTSWSTSASISGPTTYELTGLQPVTSYDVSVVAQNSAGSGTASAALTVVTSSATQLALPAQVNSLTASPTSGYAIELTWSAQWGTTAATSFAIQYRVTGSSGWSSSVTGVVGISELISGLLPATSYDFSIIGMNAAGPGPVSATVTAVTLAASPSVTLIVWNLTPSGTYTAGSGSIGVNAHVTPTGSPIQFGFSLSASSPPTNWTIATLVNTNFWGAYVPTPGTAGNWYAWAEGLDRSAPTVSPSPFVVQ